MHAHVIEEEVFLQVAKVGVIHSFAFGFPVLSQCCLLRRCLSAVPGSGAAALRPELTSVDAEAE